MISILFVIFILILVFVSGPRPKLQSKAPRTTVPSGLSLPELDNWLTESEAKVCNLIPDTESKIIWADSDNPSMTTLCFLYIHGFSATRHETSPVTERLASASRANAIYCRLAGHGVKPGMDASAEDWLQSVADAWSIASQLGEKVVIVGTSTGATLAVWLAQQEFTAGRIHALLFMSPNFGIRHHLDFLLTWPWSPKWIHLIVGRERIREPTNELEATYWIHRYSTLAIIEMQKTIDWLNKIDLASCRIPLATMYMKNDDTIDPKATVRVHEAWGANFKQLIPVTLDGDQQQHVFTGYITAPHRVDWCVERFNAFLKQIES